MTGWMTGLNSLSAANKASSPFLASESLKLAISQVWTALNVSKYFCIAGDSHSYAFVVLIQQVFPPAGGVTVI